MAEQMTITEACAKFNSTFVFDEAAKTWCLAGTTKDGNYWETNDYKASNRAAAESDAVDYLVAYND